MAFGFSPKYVQQLSLEELTPNQFLILIIEAAKASGWNVGYTSDSGLVAYTKFSMMSWGEEVKVQIDEHTNTASLKSECTGTQLADWGKNKNNVNLLINRFEQLKSLYTPDELDVKYAELKEHIVSNDDD